MNELINTQEAAPIQESAPVEAQIVNEQVAQPIEQQAPAGPPSNIPYDRFSQVVHQRNELQDKYSNLETEVSRIKEAITGPQNTGSNFESVDDLLKHVDSQVEQKLARAYQERIVPLEQERLVATYNNAIEGYFSRNPQAAKLRGEMDSYTASMGQATKDSIQNAVLQGDNSMLDMIYTKARSDKDNQLQGYLSTQQTRQVNQVAQATPYKAIRTPQTTKQDVYSMAREQNSMKPVFSQLVNELGLG